MRPMRLIGGLTLFLALPLAVRAEPLTGEVMVTAPIQVRSGPSNAYYPTSKLAPGDRVTIVTGKEIPWLASKQPPAGWLAIKPPRGSLSWVNKRFLNITGSQAVVLGETTVRVGSSVYGGLPNVEQTKLQRGAIVTITGKEQQDVDGIWIPITPAPQEVRYIPADVVKAAPPVQTAATAAPPLAPLPGRDVTSSPPPAPPPATPDDPLWTQAKKAEQEGKQDEAERLYRQLAGQTPSHDLRIRCWNQIHFLHQSQVAAAPVNPAASYYPGPASTIQPIPAQGYPNQPPPATVPPIRPASQYTYTPEIPIPNPAQKPQANYSPNQAPAPQAPVRAFAGTLLHSYRTVYGQPGFALDQDNGQLVYVTAALGLDLRPYIGHQVKLTGPVVYHPDYRKYSVTAIQVTPAP